MNLAKISQNILIMQEHKESFIVPFIAGISGRVLLPRARAMRRLLLSEGRVSLRVGHLPPEYAFAGLEAAGIEHIPEMSPDEYREQQSGLVGSHRVLGTNDGMEHLRD